MRSLFIGLAIAFVALSSSVRTIESKSLTPEESWARVDLDIASINSFVSLSNQEGSTASLVIQQGQPLLSKLATDMDYFVANPVTTSGPAGAAMQQILSGINVFRFGLSDYLSGLMNNDGQLRANGVNSINHGLAMMDAGIKAWSLLGSNSSSPGTASSDPFGGWLLLATAASGAISLLLLALSLRRGTHELELSGPAPTAACLVRHWFHSLDS